MWVYMGIYLRVRTRVRLPERSDLRWAVLLASAMLPPPVRLRGREIRDN